MDVDSRKLVWLFMRIKNAIGSLKEIPFEWKVFRLNGLPFLL